MSDKFAQLKQRLYEINALRGATALLGWDQQTYMPVGGAEDRGMQLSVLSSIAHQKFTDPEIGKLLEDLAPEAAQLDPDSDDACLVRVMQREYKKNTLIPVEKVAEFAQVTALAQEAWVQARANNDFASFRPHLERIVELRREYASYFAPYDHVYDPLLDDFEPGMKTAEVKGIFNALRPQQVALIKAIAGKENIDNTFLHGKFAEKKQWDFGVDVVTRMGFDWKCGRQDKAIHPFTTGFGIGDIRITTRFDEHYVGSALFSTMHEGGHAMYEQGIGRNLSGLPIATGASMAIHESQSRMWENLVGRSRPFWQFFFPRLQAAFPAQLADQTLDSFYKAANKVSPSLIRVEADEVTYGLHIMLRFELENEMIEGRLKIAGSVVLSVPMAFTLLSRVTVHVLDEQGQLDVARGVWQPWRAERALSLQLYRRGTALANQGRREQAENLLLRAIDIDPTNANAYHALGGFYWG
ncbi:MAG: hypothetical protein HGA86_05825, partial [Anaerolineaceae bacterium]|nr:hypothetical protein [Anaerolineaceae bacterium]